MAVKNNLKAIRKERGLQQAGVAKAVLTDARTISRYETGERNPSIEMALRLSGYLKIAMDDLFWLEN
ncbi:MAG: helix-turn-helix transcriptional regulator [Lachnospiraceae bacterium]|nr:helix-turn-helix transcriptional regulator [Lachnospiraceae bacterium]